jgi:hypothetical protein
MNIDMNEVAKRLKGYGTIVAQGEKLLCETEWGTYEVTLEMSEGDERRIKVHGRGRTEHAFCDDRYEPWQYVVWAAQRILEYPEDEDFELSLKWGNESLGQANGLTAAEFLQGLRVIRRWGYRRAWANSVAEVRNPRVLTASHTRVGLVDKMRSKWSGQCDSSFTDNHETYEAILDRDGIKTRYYLTFSDGWLWFGHTIREGHEGYIWADDVTDEEKKDSLEAFKQMGKRP